MAGHFLPAPVLLHPHGREAQALGLPGVRHFPAEHQGFVPCHNHRVAVVSNVFDLPVVGGNARNPDLTISSTCFLSTNLLSGLLTTRSSDHSRAMASASPCSIACTSSSFNRRTSCVAAFSAPGLSGVALANARPGTPLNDARRKISIRDRIGRALSAGRLNSPCPARRDCSRGEYPVPSAASVSFVSSVVDTELWLIQEFGLPEGQPQNPFVPCLDFTVKPAGGVSW